jgi:hypothetical protein
MNFETAKQLQKEISDKFLFARKNVAAYAGSDWDDAERTPTELVYDIFADVFGVDIIAHEEGGYLIQLLSEQEDLYLEPVIEYFDRDPKDMVAAVSSPYSFFLRRRPLEIGCSVSHRLNNIKGTLGCFVKGIDDGETYILSNHHVLYNSADRHDNFVIQPSAIDGGNATDAIGLYNRSLAYSQSDINKFDAAIAGPIAIEAEFQIPGANVPVTGVFGGDIQGRKVYKIGAASERTYGIIISKSANRMVLLDHIVYDFEEQIGIQGLDSNSNDKRLFAAPGDSGSLVIDVETNLAIGLLFAGNKEGMSLANPIAPVLENLRCILTIEKKL